VRSTESGEKARLYLGVGAAGGGERTGNQKSPRIRYTMGAWKVRDREGMTPKEYS